MAPKRAALSGRTRQHATLPILPCLCLTLACALFGLTLIFEGPESVDTAFVGSTVTSQRFTSSLATKGSEADLTAMRVERRRKRTAWDRGTPEWQQASDAKRAQKEALWSASQSRGAGYSSAGGGFWDAGPAPASKPKPSGGGGFQFPSFGGPAPAPLVTPPPKQPPPSQVQAPAPAASSGGDGNPFAFLAEMFGGATTTTTTTTLDPFSAFFAGLR
mmetsp:Transcript_3467/g.8634  ORF Transcript_3467/g.8634 Transcript_3467/m.8634 type:complete len:217 (+) Transcript_3467:69-719(+)